MESDESLFEGALRGDLQAFDRLYLRYERPLFGFLTRMVGDRAEAEDLFHETFLALLKGEKRGPGSFRSWLFQVARNLALNRARSKRRGDAAGEKVAGEPPEAAQGVEAVLDARAASEALASAVAELPGPLAEVYGMRVSGMSYEEMAEATRVPLGTVKSRMHEAVKRLQEVVKPWTAR